MAFGGRDVSWPDAMKDIEASVDRKKASMAITLGLNADSPRPFIVSAGSFQALKISGGYIVTFNLDREQLVELRDVCNELLDAEPALPV